MKLRAILLILGLLAARNYRNASTFWPKPQQAKKTSFSQERPAPAKSSLQKRSMKIVTDQDKILLWLIAPPCLVRLWKVCFSVTKKGLLLERMRPIPASLNREKEVFLLLARGKSVKIIAQALFISPKTAETHRYNTEYVIQKLGANSVVDLTRMAISQKADRGIMSVGRWVLDNRHPSFFSIFNI